jgi:hypothetical protein
METLGFSDAEGINRVNRVIPPRANPRHI